MHFTSRVPHDLSAQSLLDYFCKRFTYHNREKWRTIIDNDQISVNGTIAGTDYIVQFDDTIIYDAGEIEEPPANLNYSIIYEDEWIFGIDKPGNLLVHRAGKSFTHNLIFQLRKQYQSSLQTEMSLHPIHRLDRDTSGVVLIAKSTEALGAFQKEFRTHQLYKEYIAITANRFPDHITEINLPIGKAEHSLIRYKKGVNKTNGKEAHTRILAIEPLGSRATKITCQPRTGRTHQLRVHFKAYDCPLYGDRLYGMPEEIYLDWLERPRYYDNKLDFPRHALHCKELRFHHPFLNKDMHISTELPQDMEQLIGRLRQQV